MKIGRRGYVLVLVLLDEGQILLLGGQFGSLPGIYLCNFQVRQMAQETQSFNWVFKFNLHKILFLSILALTLHSKQISLLGFFCFKLFICPPDVKRPVFFWDFPFWTSAKVLSWTSFGAYDTSRSHLHFTTSKNSIFSQKWTLVKLLG